MYVCIYICMCIYIYVYMYVYNGMSTDNNCDIWVCPEKKVTQVIPSLIENINIYAYRTMGI